MITIGLTGGIGAGKSSVAVLLVEQGIPFVDTDQLAREAVEPGQPALEEIRARFGEGVFDSEGGLRRRALAETVFCDEGARLDLERILHPRIRKAWEKQLAEWRARGTATSCVVVPLLFEVGLEPCFDVTLCVACSESTQRLRLLDRGWSAIEIERRRAAQLPMGVKMERADRVVWNDGSPRLLQQQVRSLVAGLKCSDSGRAA